MQPIVNIMKEIVQDKHKVIQLTPATVIIGGQMLCRKDTMPKDTLPNGHYTEWTLRRKDSMPKDSMPNGPYETQVDIPFVSKN